MREARVDLRTYVGSVPLPNPVLTASGTAGHGAELAAYVDLASLGAVVVKSLAAAPWPGNPPPRVHETPAGMLNSVGLQGPGVGAWLAHELPALNDRGARVVASIWGSRGRGLRPGRRHAGRSARRRRRRGQRELSQPRRPQSHVRPLGPGHRARPWPRRRRAGCPCG